MSDARNLLQSAVMRGKPLKDSDDLEWFFEQGQSLFERSNLGPMLDVISNSAYTSKRCKCCEEGILTERSIANTMRSVFREIIGKKPGDWCPVCSGTGSVSVRLTSEEAQQTSSSQCHVDPESRRAQVPDEHIVRYAYVSRALTKIPRSMAKALALAYGPEGHASSLTSRGRSWVCLPLTMTGRAIMRAERDRDRGIPLRNEPERQLLFLSELAARKDKSPELTRQFAEAIEEASVILLAAERYWLWAIDGQERVR